MPATGEATAVLTVAVKVTVTPNREGLADEVNGVVVPASLTVVWTGPAVAGLKATMPSESTPS